jgi:hypothetical protein
MSIIIWTWDKSSRSKPEHLQSDKLQANTFCTTISSRLKEPLNLDQTISLNEQYEISLQGFLKQPSVLPLGFVVIFMYVNPERTE